MLKIDPEVPVSTLAKQDARLRKAFDKIGIDYYCGGEIPLKIATESLDIPFDEIEKILNNAVNEPIFTQSDSFDWSNVPLDQLINHIETFHHKYVKENLPRLCEKIAATKNSTASKYQEMVEKIERLITRLRNELTRHLKKEEDELFPAICDIANYGNIFISGLHQKREKLLAILDQLVAEHTSMGLILKELHILTNNFDQPSDCDPNLAELLFGLKNLEANLHEHIHLENNILFPQVKL